ncbi:IS3 family transposase [Dellaglioa sp. BT-FLS60]
MQCRSSKSGKQKFQVVYELRHDYPLDSLLSMCDLRRSTYYYHLKHLSKLDKYTDIKHFIREIFNKSKLTYGYRRIWFLSLKNGFNYCKETIRSLMTQLGLKVTLYNKHNSRYNSYKGTVGHVARNLLKQTFKATKPLEIFHTDVTQIKTEQGWGYISAIIDQGSKEIVSYQVSVHPDLKLINDTLNGLKNYNDNSILHSDQGFMYQNKNFQKKLCGMGIIQSMSRKGNCLDNAPIESFFSLLKRECLNRETIVSITDLKEKMADYINWYNNERISLNKKGMTPVEYRESYRCHTLN